MDAATLSLCLPCPSASVRQVDGTQLALALLSLRRADHRASHGCRGTVCVLSISRHQALSANPSQLQPQHLNTRVTTHVCCTTT